MKRFFHLVLWFLLGTLVGFPIGWYGLNYRMIRNEKYMATWIEGATVDYYAKAEYRYADHESARQALLYSIQTLNRLRSDKSASGPSVTTDLCFSYGELSLLEESAGNTDLARKYMAQAVQTLTEAGMKAPHASETYIRERLAKEPFVEAALPEKP